MFRANLDVLYVEYLEIISSCSVLALLPVYREWQRTLLTVLQYLQQQQQAVTTCLFIGSWFAVYRCFAVISHTQYMYVFQYIASRNY